MVKEKKIGLKSEKISAPKVEPKKLGTLGKYKIEIHSLSKKVLNGITYNDVHLINGQAMLLSDKDLAEQKDI